MGLEKKNQSGSGFYQKTRDLARLKTRYPKITKIPSIYIYIFLYSNPNPSFLHSSAATHADTHTPLVLTPHVSPNNSKMEKSRALSSSIWLSRFSLSQT